MRRHRKADAKRTRRARIAAAKRQNSAELATVLRQQVKRARWFERFGAGAAAAQFDSGPPVPVRAFSYGRRAS